LRQRLGALGDRVSGEHRGFVGAIERREIQAELLCERLVEKSRRGSRTIAGR
jgi:hypothetical protein